MQQELVQVLVDNGNGRKYADLTSPSPGLTIYTYGDAAHKHAVTSLSTGETYTYDANGNMIQRVENGQTYTQVFDMENRLASVTVGGQTTQFVYDGDGNLVKKVNPDGSKTIYVGGVYEVDKSSGGSVTHTRVYYPAGGAMRVDGTLYYVLKDHLGSASVITTDQGTEVGTERYYPYGETRLTTGTMFTDKLYTGQREITGLGIYHYQARFYSPSLGRFLSADTIIPSAGNPQDWNRFSYARNNPLKYTDPSGHKLCGMDNNGGCDKKEELWNYAEGTLERLGGKNDLEAMARIVDKAAKLFGTYETMIPALSGIFLGIEESNSTTIYNAAIEADACDVLGHPVCPANAETPTFGDAGFHEDFQDGQSQPFHLWAYLATAANAEGTGPASYLPGMAVNALANLYHEIIHPDGAGATWQDFALSIAGSNIGTLVNIGAIPPSQLGNTIRDYVGTDGPGASWVNPLIFIAPLQGNK